MTAELVVEIECRQSRMHGESLCGDTFTSRKIPEQGRILSVLSDGLGKGVKASILSTMTAAMALRLVASDCEIIRSAETIMDALPTCQVRKIGYATFTIVDNRQKTGIRIIEMDNPPFVLIRNGEAAEVESRTIASRSRQDRVMRISTLEACPGDRLVIFTDGITQAGLGTEPLKGGWRRDGCQRFIADQVQRNPSLSAGSLAQQILNEALRQEPGRRARDDMTAAVFSFRRPRPLLVLSGPPFARERDGEFAHLLDSFNGRKAICGGTTAEIVARELGREITTDLETCAMKVPPSARMDGIDLVTEGILTLTRVAHLLEQQLQPVRSDAAAQLLGLLGKSDTIDFVVGTRINEAHQDPSHPVDLEIRRAIIKRISRVLEERHLKDVRIRYI